MLAARTRRRGCWSAGRRDLHGQTRSRASRDEVGSRQATSLTLDYSCWIRVAQSFAGNRTAWCFCRASVTKSWWNSWTAIPTIPLLWAVCTTRKICHRGSCPKTRRKPACARTARSRERLENVQRAAFRRQDQGRTDLRAGREGSGPRWSRTTRRVYRQERSHDHHRATTTNARLKKGHDYITIEKGERDHQGVWTTSSRCMSTRTATIKVDENESTTVTTDRTVSRLATDQTHKCGRQQHEWTSTGNQDHTDWQRFEGQVGLDSSTRGRPWATLECERSTWATSAIKASVGQHYHRSHAEN